MYYPSLVKNFTKETIGTPTASFGFRDYSKILLLL